MTAPVTLQARGRSRRRLRVNRVAEGASVLAALIAVGFLAILVGSVLVRAFHALDWNFFTKGPAVFGQTGGGMAPALVGTLLLVLVATHRGGSPTRSSSGSTFSTASRRS